MSIPTKVPTVLQKRGLPEWIIVCKSMKNLAPQVGFESTTLRLTAKHIMQPDAVITVI
jgi:hypothetical protein